MSEQLAIIRRPVIGVGDRGVVTLSFSTFISESEAADQWLYGSDINTALLESGVSDVKQLEGWPCWVERSDDQLLFRRMWKRGT